MAQKADRVAQAQAPGATRAEWRDGADEVSNRRWLILGVVCLGQLMVVLDATVVNIALPSAQHDLAFNNAGMDGEQVPLHEVPASRPHDEGRDLILEPVGLALGAVEGELAADRGTDRDLAADDVRPRRRE